jgi:phosphatidylinositol alpha-mannosyltransferase|uniref:Glycosyltransferase family 1 protein n=1 Tax=Thermodesulfobium narugense TaxID=184064 RepID=A0A7C5PF57_9BACT
MKVALVSPYSFSFKGGVNSHLFFLQKYLEKYDIEAHIIAPAEPGKPLAYNVEHSKFHTVGRSFPFMTNGSIARLAPTPGAIGKILLLKENFDLWHVHEPFAPGPSLFSIFTINKPIVGTFHAYSDIPFPFEWFKPISKRFSDKINIKIAVSEASMHFAEQYISGEFKIIPNGVNIEIFAPLEKYQQPTILFVGRLEKRKGLDVILRAWNKIFQKFPNAQLRIAGYSTEKRINKFQGLDGIVFLGELSEENLAKEYARAWIFCSPALGGESFGMTILEALSCGTAVIASNITGYRSLLKNGQYGLLVEPNDSNDLASKICYLIKNIDARKELERKARPYAINFAWEKITSAVVELYKEAIANFKTKL